MAQAERLWGMNFSFACNVLAIRKEEDVKRLEAFFATIKMLANLGVLTFIGKEEVLQIMCEAY